MAASAARTAFTIEPCSYREVRELSAELGVSEPVAMMLVRRGYRTAVAARDFLAAAETHDPFEFDAMEEVVEGLLAAAGAGLKVTVHGDYDTDGVASTAILVAALRDAGAECDWYIPDRLADGYGLSAATVRRLAAAGTRLLVTVDCGVGCPDEVALARELGLEVIVTDHHEPGERLPECPILHPRLSGYPFGELCATAVAYKLASALRERAGIDAADVSDLDLVALATVADLVPLRGENRALVREGLAEARRGQRLGLRALIAAAGCEIERLDEGDLAFRLAPRINAAGRLYRADAGVELMLTSDPDRAEAIAEELNRANSERRFAEREALAGAESALAALPGEDREAPAVVIAGEGWHPGVVGIVASRMVELHWRPSIVIGLDADGRGRGSGRSIPGFDLLAGLQACSEHLERFGGHRAAAGLEVRAENVAAFRAAFAEHAASVLTPADLVRSQPVDAIVGGESLGLPVAEELERLAPFGKGNPEPRLLVPAARVRDVRPMGEEGRHARFSLQSGARRALGVAFGVNGELDRAAAGGPLDVAVKLELNHWNGAVEPRVVLSELYGQAPGLGGEAPRAADGPACSTAAGAEEWWRLFDAEMRADLEAAPPRPSGPSARTVVDRLGDSPVACIAGLLSTGTSVLAICADVARRRGLAESAADPARFGGGEAVLACGRCAAAPMEDRVGALTTSGRGLALADWGALELSPRLAEPFEHVVVVDPPPFAELESLAGRGEGYLHLAWGGPELELALRVHDSQWPLRPVLAASFRALREATLAAGGELAGEDLLVALAGGERRPASARIAARSARVLTDLGLVEWARKRTSRSLGVVSSVARDLERSASFRAYRARHEEGKRFLNNKKQR
ncbi:MAG TPA: single-stranded-DNA-specific exonuclease RecJ [Solirubrobacterales bacterium]